LNTSAGYKKTQNFTLILETVEKIDKSLLKNHYYQNVKEICRKFKKDLQLLLMPLYSFSLC